MHIFGFDDEISPEKVRSLIKGGKFRGFVRLSIADLVTDDLTNLINKMLFQNEPVLEFVVSRLVGVTDSQKAWTADKGICFVDPPTEQKLELVFLEIIADVNNGFDEPETRLPTLTLVFPDGRTDTQ